ncbi:universal stress protein [Candidatus Thorarchaeota archaeon]|nr:MAG: universal stress protein [Candidatus Thorarchaeota archaeon]
MVIYFCEKVSFIDMDEISYCEPGHIFCRTQKILLAVDGSEGSARAATVAFEVAQMTKSKLFVIHVIPIPLVKQVALMSDGDADEILLKYAAKGETLLEGVKDASKGYGLDIELILERGSPPERIVAQVIEKGVDLIVIGARGATGGGSRSGLGSSVERVTYAVDIPVLVVK